MIKEQRADFKEVFRNGDDRRLQVLIVLLTEPCRRAQVTENDSEIADSKQRKAAVNGHSGRK